MTIIKISQPLLESLLLTKAAANKEWRGWMLGICFDAQFNAYSTNGHCLAVSKLDEPIDGLAEKWPGVILDIAKTPAACKKYEQAEINVEAGEIRYMAAGGEQLGLAQVTRIDAPLPRAVELLEKPPAAPAAAFTFNPGYLAMIEKMAGFYEKKLSKKIYVEIRGNDRCALMVYEPPQCNPLKFMVAPIKI